MHARTAVAVLLLSAVALAAERLPAAAELHALRDAGKWAELLSATSRVLTLRGPAAKAYDRVDVWTMKAEAQLQGDQYDAAAASLSKAAAEPGVTAEQADQAIAHGELFKKSERRGYKTPARLGDVKIFAVKDVAKRPEALAALLSVDVTELTAKIDAAKGVTNAKALVELAEQSGQLAHLDRVVNKSSDQSDALQKRLAENVVAAATAWGEKVDQQLAKMTDRATEEVDQRVRGPGGRIFQQKAQRGYQPADMTEAIDLARQAQSWAETIKSLRTPMNPVGRSALQPAESVVQAAYDKAKAIQSAFVKPQTQQPGATSPPPPPR